MTTSNSVDNNNHTPVWRPIYGYIKSLMPTCRHCGTYKFTGCGNCGATREVQSMLIEPIPTIRSQDSQGSQGSQSSCSDNFFSCTNPCCCDSPIYKLR
jgi:hypothetical protein